MCFFFSSSRQLKNRARPTDATCRDRPCRDRPCRDKTASHTTHHNTHHTYLRLIWHTLLRILFLTVVIPQACLWLHRKGRPLPPCDCISSKVSHVGQLHLLHDLYLTCGAGLRTIFWCKPMQCYRNNQTGIITQPGILCLHPRN